MNKKNPFSSHAGYSPFGASASENTSATQENDSTENAPSNAPPQETLFNEESQLKDLFPEGFGEDLNLGDGVTLQQGTIDSVTDEDLTAECKKRLCPQCPVKKEAEDSYMRALADLENAKKRLTKEREEMKRFATESVLNDIIPALDNLDLALQYAPTEGAAKDFVMGVDMTRKLMLDALKKHGLEEVGQLGQPFDPALHEAVGVADVPEIPVDHVCNLLAKGYSLQGKLLRPARVTVCKR